jgi:hypothetical protein
MRKDAINRAFTAQKHTNEQRKINRVFGAIRVGENNYS